MSKPVYVVRARRTPQGRFLGALANYSSTDLAVAAGRATLDMIPKERVDLVVMGNVLPPVLNVARQSALHLGIPEDTPAFTVNMACASGMQAIVLGANAIRLDEADVVLCGGTESMTNSPHFLSGARQGYRLANGKLEDSLLLGLSDPFIGEAMYQTAERLAQKYQISRERQDSFALRSHSLAVKAQNEGRFNAEIVPLPELQHDEHPRGDTSLSKLAGLKPLVGPDGTVSAGNSSGINDGAAMVLLASESAVEKNGWTPLARIGASASQGCDPKIMGIGPVHAIRKLLDRTGQRLCEFDRIEINEAFAAQALSCAMELQLADDEDRFNRDRSGIALGHPVGASGARLIVHLAHAVAGGAAGRTLASVCVGGGMGIATIVEAI